ncbi:MAG: hypothetical protein LBB43_05160 [Spirochaetaceae bacterium]|nr:hypothetical protein [Spirochaetaceae bacterium]
MKKVCFLTVVMVALVSAIPVFAQDAGARKSDVYYVNVPIEKIYPYSKGYVVAYRDNIDDVLYTYLPYEWFFTIGGRGDIISLGSGTSWPYLTVFYKAGTFNHVRLYIRPEANHPSWGSIINEVNLDEHFDPEAEDLKLYFDRPLE